MSVRSRRLGPDGQPHRLPAGHSQRAAASPEQATKVAWLRRHVTAGQRLTTLRCRSMRTLSDTLNRVGAFLNTGIARSEFTPSQATHDRADVMDRAARLAPRDATFDRHRAVVPQPCLNAHELGVFRRSLAVDAQGSRLLRDVRVAVAGIRMIAQPLRSTGSALCLECAKHCRHVPRIVAGARHDLRSKNVRLTLVLAAVLEKVCAQPEVRSLCDQAARG